MLSAELAALYRRDLRRLVQEIEAFPDTASLWRTVPGVTNAAGTLALHLEGNLREYIGRHLGRLAFTRDRPLEFSARGVDRHELVARVSAVAAMIPGVIDALSDEALGAGFPDPFLGVPMTTRQFLIHNHGHLNYHLGQIDYLRRVNTGDAALALAGL
jgi:hypothetical protein